MDMCSLQRTLACGLGLAVAACRPPATNTESTKQPPSIDSLVLERTVCFGFCPAYRLRITSAEEIRFESRNRGDSGNVAIDTAASGTYAALISKARAAGFYSFPPEIRKDSVLCHNYATDHFTVITTIFSRPATKQVVDYHGCFETPEHGNLPQIEKLRAFENDVDSTLRSSRWVRPNRPAK